MMVMIVAVMMMVGIRGGGGGEGAEGHGRESGEDYRFHLYYPSQKDAGMDDNRTPRLRLLEI